MNEYSFGSVLVRVLWALMWCHQCLLPHLTSHVQVTNHLANADTLECCKKLPVSCVRERPRWSMKGLPVWTWAPLPRLHIHIAHLQIFRNPNASRLDVIAHLSFLQGSGSLSLHFRSSDCSGDGSSPTREVCSLPSLLPGSWDFRKSWTELQPFVLLLLEPVLEYRPWGI